MLCGDSGKKRKQGRSTALKAARKGLDSGQKSDVRQGRYPAGVLLCGEKDQCSDRSSVSLLFLFLFAEPSACYVVVGNQYLIRVPSGSRAWYTRVQ